MFFLVAHVEAGDPKQTMISGMVEVYGLKISKTYVPGGICAVGALEFIYDKYGHETLDRTLRLALGTWEGERLSLTSVERRGRFFLFHRPRRSRSGSRDTPVWCRCHGGRFRLTRFVMEQGTVLLVSYTD